MKKAYAIHDDAESYIGRACRLPDGNYGRVMAVIDNEKCDPEAPVDAELNAIKVFIVYHYEKDDILTTPYVELLKYIPSEVDVVTASKMVIHMTCDDMVDRVESAVGGGKKMSWESIGTYTHCLTVGLQSATQSMADKDKKDMKGKIRTSIYWLMLAYQKLIKEENENG